MDGSNEDALTAGFSRLYNGAPAFIRQEFAPPPRGWEHISPKCFQLYGLFRDYIKHEDGLMQSRLAASLTLNTFLIAGSMVVLGAMIQAFSNKDLSPDKLLLIVVLAVFLHTVIAALGHYSARATNRSLQTTSRALQALEDLGNSMFGREIAEDRLPALTNGRLLKSAELAGQGEGAEIMRSIPSMLRWLWLMIGAMPFIFLVVVLVAYPATWQTFLAHFHSRA